MKSRDYVKGYMQDLIEKDKKRDELLYFMKRMARPQWDFDPAIKAARPDLRAFVDTTPSDAVENGAIALSNTAPRFTVMPFLDNLDEYARAEACEQVLHHFYRKANDRGTGTLLYDKARSSLITNGIATRVDDLAYILPKDKKSWTPLQKAAWASGRFIVRAFDFCTVHYDISDMGLTAICQAENVRAMDEYKYWKLYESDPLVKKALKAMEEKFENEKAGGKSPKSLRFMRYYFMDYDQIFRCGAFVPDVGEMDLSEIKDEIVFAEQENDFGFINWSIRAGGTRIESAPEFQINPMLAPLYWGNIWETTNIVQSIVMSEPIKRLENATRFEKSADGTRLPERDGVIVGGTQDDVKSLGYDPIDPQNFGIVERMNQATARVTGAAALSDINNAVNATYSTFNAVFNVVMSRLDIQRRDMALSCADEGKLFYKWAKFDKEPMTMYRSADKNMMSAQYLRGAEVTVTADDFDADAMELFCDITPKTMTDFQQQVLSAIQLNQQMRVPRREALEKLGFENVSLLDQQYAFEKMNDAELDAAVQNIMMQAQVAGQIQAQAQMQAPTTMPNPGAQMSQQANGPLGNMGQGYNPAAGGTPTIQSTPGLTREAVQNRPMR
jgi:hypothetical protein